MTARIRRTPRDFFIGIDIGTRNCGISIYQPARGCARLMSVDLLVDRDGRLRRMEERGTEAIVGEVMEELHAYLRRAVWVGIEKQMKRRFIVLATSLLATINATHGNKCVWVAPQSVRAHFGIRGSSYEDRKAKSALLARRMLSRDDFRLCERAFNTRGDGANHVDAYEAFLIAKWLEAHQAKIVCPAPLRPAKRQPRRPTPRLRVVDVVLP